MMKRRTFLKASAAGLVALIGGGAALYSQVPVIPKRPNPDLEDAAGWISYRDGLYRLVLPRIEMGQNIATAMKQIACTELDVSWEDVVLELHDTVRPGPETHRRQRVGAALLRTAGPGLRRPAGGHQKRPAGR